MSTTESLRCACGAWSGERCEEHAAVEAMMVAAWVPEQNRATAAAMGLKSIEGCGRVRLTEGLLVSRACASRMRRYDSQWVEIIGEVVT